MAAMANIHPKHTLHLKVVGQILLLSQYKIGGVVDMWGV